jgi:hypothetical protein
MIIPYQEQNNIIKYCIYKLLIPLFGSNFKLIFSIICTNLLIYK